MANSKADFVKVRLSGKLTLNSELHIGSGELAEIKTWPNLPEASNKKNDNDNDSNNDNNNEKVEGTYHCIYKDYNNQPAIPGSSLRGALLNRFNPVSDETEKGEHQNSADDRPLWQEAQALRTLFGFTSNDNVHGERGASKVRFLDAVFDEAQPKLSFSLDSNAPSNNGISKVRTVPVYYCETTQTLLRPGVQINGATGASEDKKLFHTEVVACGTQFKWDIEAENLSQKELTLLLQLLNTFDGTANRAIGSKKNNGQGQITWKLDKLEVVKKQDYQNWLRHISDNDFQPLRLQPVSTELLQRLQIEDEEGKRWLTQGAAGVTHFKLRIHALSPILINDPHLVKPSAKNEGKENENKGGGDPKQLYRRTYDGRPILPASSLKGVLRAQSQRIAATIALQKAKQHPLLNTLEEHRLINLAVSAAAEFGKTVWGSEQQQGALRFNDFIGTDATNDSVEHPQFFTAIDRFTGGVKDGALFNSIATTCPTFNGECWVNTALLKRNSTHTSTQKSTEALNENSNQGWQALLLFTLKDAMLGELHIGSGAAKGYGHFMLQVQEGNNTANQGTEITDALAQFDRFFTQHTNHEEAQQWLNQLEENLVARMQILNSALNETSQSAPMNTSVTQGAVRHG